MLVVVALAIASHGACPCLSSYPAGVDPTAGVAFEQVGETIPYPSEYGLNSCLAHDDGLAPYCSGNNTEDFCEDVWCFVDQNACDVAYDPSDYFAGSGLHYSYETCGSSSTSYEQHQRCITGCLTNAVVPSVSFFLAETISDSFWFHPTTGVKAFADLAADHFGVSLSFSNFDTTAELVAAIGEHASTRPTVPLLIKVSDGQVAAAAQTALALGVPIYGLNSNAGDATGLSAYVGMSELVAGVQAAEHLLSRGVTRPVFVDHGTPIGGGATQGWAAGRWAGFNATMSARLGVSPARVPIGVVGDAWASDGSLAPLSEFVHMTEALTAPLGGLFGAASEAHRCRYDGIFAAGSTSLRAVAWALDDAGCWADADQSGSGVADASGNATIVATVDKDELGVALRAAGHDVLTIDQRQDLQGYLSVALAALSINPANQNTPLTPLLGRIDVSTNALVSGAAGGGEGADEPAPCDAFCVLEQAFAGAGSPSARCTGRAGGVTVSQLSGGGTLNLNGGTGFVPTDVDGDTVRVCSRQGSASDPSHVLSALQRRCGAEAGLGFCVVSALDKAREETAACQAEAALLQNISAAREAEAEAREEALVQHQTTLMVGLVCGIVLVLLLIVVGLAARVYLRRQRESKKYHEQQRRRVKHSIELNEKLSFPVALMPYGDFMQLERLVPFETQRQKLVYLDRMQELVSACKDEEELRIVFFSHEWTSFTEPDHTGRQYAVLGKHTHTTAPLLTPRHPSSPCATPPHRYAVMKAALAEVVRRNGWDTSRVVVWLDIVSVPQANRDTQTLAINSFVQYAANAHAFVMVVPPVVHRERMTTCDLSTYRRRMWCRAEQLSHFLKNGTSFMWVAAAEDAIRPHDKLAQTALVGGSETTHDFLDIFAGDATVETDKLDLVMPLLGLYAVLLAERTHSERSDDSESFKASPKAPVLAQIERSKERLFPRELRIAAGKLVAGDDGAAGPRTTTVDETRELFGDLVERLEATVLADDEESTRQRARLVQHGRAHSISRQSSSPSAV